MWIGGESDVIKRAMGVVPCHKPRAAVEIGSVFGGIAEGIDRPGSIVCIGTEIVDARLVQGNRRFRGEIRGRVREIDVRAAGEDPRLDILGQLQGAVPARVLYVLVLSDKTKQGTKILWSVSHM